MFPALKKRQAARETGHQRTDPDVWVTRDLSRWTDERLVEAAQSGLAQAFEELVRRHQHRVYNLAVRYTNDVEAALDLTQDAFLKAYEMLPSFRREANFYTWFYRIVMNLCIDRHRRRTARGEHYRVSLETLAEEMGQPESARDEEGLVEGLISPDAEEETVRKETRQLVWKAVEQLPEPLKQVILLREYEGLSLKEISDILRTRVGTVKSRLYQARQALRKLLAPYLG